MSAAGEAFVLDRMAQSLMRIAEGRMTLVDAIRVFGPKSGVEAHDRAMDDAATLIWSAMQEMVRSKSGRMRDLYEDAASNRLLHLQERGPRGIRGRDGDDDAWARGFLRTCLNRRVLDMLREGAGDVEPTDEVLGGFEEGLDDWTEEEIASASELLAEARRRVLHEIGPEIAAGKRGDSGETFRATLAEMDEVERGSRTASDLVDDEEASTPRGEVRTRRQCANAVYQRHFRVLVALRDHVDRLRALRMVTRVEHSSLRMVLDALRLRKEAS